MSNGNTFLLSLMAEVYSPKNSLFVLHDTPRVGGTNEISILGADTITQMTGPLFSYLLGVGVPAAMFVLFFLIWAFSLLCTRCCCEGRCCGKQIRVFVFVVFCSLSLLGWFLGLIGNSNVTAGFNAMLAAVDSVQGLGEQAINLTTQTTEFTKTMFQLSLDMETQCQNPNISFPFSNITGPLNDSINTVSGPTNGIVSRIEGINSEIDKHISLVVDYIKWREVGTMIVLIVVLVVLSIFMVSTALREAKSIPESLRCCMRCASKSTSWIVFILGFILLLVLWIMVVVIHIVATVGADFCVPDVNSNLNRIGAEALNMPTAQVCTSSGFDILCFYQTCAGSNPLGVFTQNIENFNTQGLSELKNFTQQLESINVTVSSACYNSIDAFEDASGDINKLVNSSLNLISCPRVNSVYADVLYDGICNGMVDGLYFTYVSLIIGGTFMMLAMTTFMTFDFDREEEDQVYEAQVISVQNETGKPVESKF